MPGHRGSDARREHFGRRGDDAGKSLFSLISDLAGESATGNLRLPDAAAAAERLGVGYSTFKRWIHTGRVRTSRTEGGHHKGD